MKTKLDIAIVVGTRPEIIRLSRVISVLDKKTNLTIYILVKIMIMS